MRLLPPVPTAPCDSHSSADEEPRSGSQSSGEGGGDSAVKRWIDTCHPITVIPELSFRSGPYNEATFHHSAQGGHDKNGSVFVLCASFHR